ncbi:FAD/NAD(P)-binding protein [Dyadobacter sandarakinus]|uniref:FAD/NAD(P)-binding protein n=1 Tax=Dyadobacter sandarakinus TaxID=2747268 RepID=A0ABX7I488_9BACT|nr:FAD/NAD(P)-binding protein [Dyadobacter sandarakinus]QRR00327.1 FAD/NAD(P)-binding protein [Dyadobacter sandarakinus]
MKVHSFSKDCSYLTPTGIRKIAILGAGPAGLFAYKRLIESGARFDIVIFEKTDHLGAGMPYSVDGANREHITNVSDNELPEIVTSVSEWIRTVPAKTLDLFGIDPDKFHEYTVLPRLLFGMYLSDQFEILRGQAAAAGIKTEVRRGSEVTDIIDHTEEGKVVVETNNTQCDTFDCVLICTGHKWPDKHEGALRGYFDSPYPPSKLGMRVNHPVALTGSSLTAIDAIRTLARHNGSFSKAANGAVTFTPDPESPKFRIVMHSRNGLLPAIRFHLDEPQLSSDSLLTDAQIAANMKQNDGFLSLDFLFEQNFKIGFKKKDAAFYERIKDMQLETFVQMVMDMREGKDPFKLFIEEYKEAEKSIAERKSVYWKEMLAELSYTLNYPAKYLSAEDMIRLRKVLMPLIAIVIAFVPQSSCDELLALHAAGKLDIVTVGSDGEVRPHPEEGVLYHYTDEQGKKHRTRFKTYINCTGQPHIAFEDFPFKSMLSRETVSRAMIRFKSAEAGAQEKEQENKDVVQNIAGDYFLTVPGVTINDCFQVVNNYGVANPRIYIMAVPYIGGYNPDYSGLDFCDQASKCIADAIISMAAVTEEV